MVVVATADPSPKGDKPRKVIAAHPSEARQIQAALAVEWSDVLVVPNRYVEPGEAFVMDHPDVLLERLMAQPYEFGV